MQSTVDALLEAHIRHELARFTPRKLRQAIREEVAALFRWARSTKLLEVVVPEQVVALIDRSVVQPPLAGGVSAIAREMSQRVRASRHNKATAIQDICPGEVFGAIVTFVAMREQPRQRLIHRLVTSPVYTEQLSSALFNGIKEYLLADNMLAQKVPGLGSLIKLGKFAVNKTMRPLEAAVEKTVKAYIEASLGNTIRRSEQSINEHFDAARIVGAGDRLWASLAPRKLTEFARMLDGDDLDAAVGIGLDFWEHFRKTAYFKAIHSDLVRHFFEKYGDAPLAAIAGEFGMTEKLVVEALSLSLGRGVEAAAASGFLEQRIRTRLADFYRSPQAAALLATAAAPLAATPSRARRATPSSPDAPAISKAPVGAPLPARRNR